MAQAKVGDTVWVHYTGRLDDGTVFNASNEQKPLRFKIGESELLPALQQAVVGMKPGESRNIRIMADAAYGPRREEMVVAVDRKKFPKNIEPYVGMELDVCQHDGKVIPAKVADISECSVTLDANHPLAGKDVTFDIELVEIVLVTLPSLRQRVKQL